jgi:hypothetical protein
VSIREILKTDAPGYDLFREWRKRNVKKIEERLKDWNEGRFSISDTNPNGWGLIPN